MHPTERPHLEDTTLLARAHEQPIGTDRAVSAHLAGCPACAARLAELREGDAGVASLLAALDHPVPRRSFATVTRPAPAPAVRRGLAAAAAAALLATAAAAAIPASPLHQWLRRQLAPEQPATQAPAPAALPAQGDQATAGVAVSARGALLVVINRRQPTGSIDLRVAPGDATVRARGGDVAYAVGENRVTIDNRRPADAYLMTVPPDLRELRIVVEGRPLYRRPDARATDPAADSASHLRIPLDGSPPVPFP